MKLFGVIKVQQGEGCDYSIGCGTCFDTIQADSMKDAVKKLTAISEDGDDSDESLASTFDQEERTLKLCIVFPMDSSKDITEDFERSWSEMEKKKELEKDAEEEENEKEEYQRLKKKFGK